MQGRGNLLSIAMRLHTVCELIGKKGRLAGREAMKIVIGTLLAFAIGALCKVAGVPVPAPPAIMGALLVFSMTSGYVLAGRYARARQEGDPS